VALPFRKLPRASCVVDQAVIVCIECQFEAVANAELAENVLEIVFHCLLADEEFLRDFFVAVRLGNKLDNFIFALLSD
jgi:hypothetical protein